MLIDALEARTDNIQMVSPRLPPRIEIESKNISIKLDGDNREGYEITAPAFESLLNIIRLPIKYVERLIEQDGGKLAQDNINFWLAGRNMSFLMDSKDIVTQVFDCKKLYIPSLTVNDEIMDSLPEAKVLEWQLHDDVFHAIYIGRDNLEIDGTTFFVGIRVLYSDCFNSPPRFDGVLYSFTSQVMFSYPIQNRKFRVASNSVAEILEQIREFIALGIDAVTNELAPQLKDKMHTEYVVSEFLPRMCSDLRLSSKILQQLSKGLSYSANLMELVGIITDNCNSNHIDIAVTREIQVAIAKFVVTGQFK